MPGINQVSEGHASVPAIRGLARGRTLILIDGGRVTSERRVGSERDFADRPSFEGIDVARGPGSVAYGSDAFGGVISVRTRRAAPGSPFRVGGTVSAAPASRKRAARSRPPRASKRAASSSRPTRATPTTGTARKTTPNLQFGLERQRVRAARRSPARGGPLSAGWQSDFGRDIDRPRNNSRTVRFYYPYRELAPLDELVRAGQRGRPPADDLHRRSWGRSNSERTRIASRRRHGAAASSARTLKPGTSTSRAAPRAASARPSWSSAWTSTDASASRRMTSHSSTTRRATSPARPTTSRSTTHTGRTSARTCRPKAPSVAGAAVGRRARRQRHDREHRRIFRRQIDVERRILGLRRGDRRAVRRTEPHGPGRARLPRSTLSDRYFRGPSGRGFITGNPDLEPETSLQYDFAARYALSRTQLAFFLYRYKIDDLIERYRRRRTFSSSGTGAKRRLNGFEIEARTELGRRLRGRSGAADRPRRGARRRRGTRRHLARHVLGQVRRTSQPRIRPASHGVRRGRRPAGPSEVVAPGATIMDLGGGWRFSSHLELRGIVRNLLDDDYYASPDPRWVYAPGRSAA